MAKQPTALIILDGFANRESEHGNAVKQAHKPNFDRYYNTYPTTQIEASGLAVSYTHLRAHETRMFIAYAVFFILHSCVVNTPVSYTHLTLPTNSVWCRSRWSPYH